jgi:lycopene beta-cyclase
MAAGPLRGRSMLVIDRDAKQHNDRTWCYWSARPGPFDSLAHRTWEQVRFTSPGLDAQLPLGPYRYRLVRGIDFYRHTRSVLADCPGVTLLQASVEKVVDGESRAAVSAAGQTFTADFVFNSLYHVDDRSPQPGRYHSLWQHFKGWEIETDRAVFDPRTPVLFDFRTPQNGTMRFFYILPYSEKHALVEYTLFSANLLSDAEYNAGLTAYLQEVLHLKRYSVLSEEKGIIPMTDRPFARRAGARVLNTGTRGGQVKPSSGYAFARIQRDCAAIIQSLQTHGHPFAAPAHPARYRLFDTLMLQVMLRQGDRLAGIFSDLFRRNPIQRIFGFLDEENPLGGDLRLLASLDPGPFLWALLRVKILGKI